MKHFLRAIFVLVVLALAALGWDVWQVRALQPPSDRSFEGFVIAGRQGSFLIDAPGERLYWVAPPPKTLMSYPEPPVYEFNRSGELMNWTPGTEDHRGMLGSVPVLRQGVPAGLNEVRAWLRPR